MLPQAGNTTSCARMPRCVLRQLWRRLRVVAAVVSGSTIVVFRAAGALRIKGGAILCWQPSLLQLDKVMERVVQRRASFVRVTQGGAVGMGNGGVGPFASCKQTLKCCGGPNHIGAMLIVCLCRQALLEKLDTLTKLQPRPRAGGSPTAPQQAAAAEPSEQAQPPLSPVLSSESVGSPAGAGESLAQQPSTVGEPEATPGSVGYGEASGALSDGAFMAESPEPVPGTSHGSSAASEQVEVQLEEGADGEVRFKLALSPIKVPASADSAGGAADPGHTRTPPPEGAAAVTAALPQLARRPRSEEMPARPGALTNQAAKGEEARAGERGCI
jgi:hypothetical protein